MTRNSILQALLLSVAGMAINSTAGAQDLQREALLFGKRAAVASVNISPDGDKIVYIAPGAGASSVVRITDLTDGNITTVASVDGKPFRLSWCDWANMKRIVCGIYGVTDRNMEHVDKGFYRLLAFDENGDNLQELKMQSKAGFRWDQTSDGEIISWLDDDTALIARFHVPENRQGALSIQDNTWGYGVDKVDLSTGKAKSVEYPNEHAVDYIADDHGNVRIKGEYQENGSKNKDAYSTIYSYRRKDNSSWTEFSRVTDDIGLQPLAFAEDEDSVYAFENLNGRLALYKVKLDGTMHKELMLANSKVDVDALMVLGKRGRVIGTSYATDKRRAFYFDKELEKLVGMLEQAIPGNPTISIVSASDNERLLIVEATTTLDSGRIYAFNRDTNKLTHIMYSNPAQEGAKFGAVKPIEYVARDGTKVPGYLTLPPVGAGKNLPTIIMPHGGPAARDEYGFDWIAQYFAARGFAVLQPNYRGSAGYGEDWFGNNAYQDWSLAMNDINDGARWLAKEGIANPDKLAIFGWSYGGYAALQTNVVEPDLYKAVVAVAPVVDLNMLLTDGRREGNYVAVKRMLGKGDHLDAGSPLKHVDAIKAPVLLISGDADLNVDVRHAKRMADALKKSGKKGVELVIYEDLDHSIVDSDARIDLLTRSDAFIRGALGIK